MALAIPAILVLFLLVTFWYVAKLILTPLIVGTLQRVPAVGGFLARKADDVVTSVENTVARWLGPHLATMAHWLHSATSATRALPGAVEDFALDARDAVRHLVETSIPRLVHTVTNPIVHRANATEHSVTALVHDLAATEQRLQHGIEAGQRDLEADFVARLTHGIDRLRHDVFSEAIPGIEHDVATVARGAEAATARVASDVAGIGAHLGDLAKRLDIPLSVLEALVASVGAVAALEALETLATCRGKLKTLCTSNPAIWAEFIAGLALLAAWPGLVPLAEETAVLLEAELDVLEQVIRG